MPNGSLHLALRNSTFQRPDWRELCAQGAVEHINGDALCDYLQEVDVPGGALILCEATEHVCGVTVHDVMAEICQVQRQLQADLGVVALVGPRAHSALAGSAKPGARQGRGHLLRDLTRLKQAYPGVAEVLLVQESPPQVSEVVSGLRLFTEANVSRLVQDVLAKLPKV